MPALGAWSILCFSQATSSYADRLLVLAFLLRRPVYYFWTRSQALLLCFWNCRSASRLFPIQSIILKHAAQFAMTSLRALYVNFKNDYGDLLEVTDFSIATWLAFGACLQLLSQSWLPSGLSYWLPLTYVLYRIARVSIDCRRIFTGTFTNVVFGRWSATLPEPEDLSAVTATSDGVVMFLLGARINQFVTLLTP